MKRAILAALMVVVQNGVAYSASRTQARSMVITRQGIVATSHTLASQAGAQVLARGGSAVDAAIEGVGDPLERIARAIRAYLAFYDGHPELVELLIQERAEFRDRKKPTYFEHCDASVGPWRDLLRALIAEGRVRKMPVERITDVASDLLYGTMFTNFFAGRRKTYEAQAQDMLDIVLNGILSDRERARRAASGKKP